MWGGSGRGGADVIDVEGEGKVSPDPSAPKRKGRCPQGDTSPPPPHKAPRMAIPAERAELSAGRRQRGAVQELVEQQQQLQRAGAWKARAISAEAANCDLEARLSGANEDRWAAESWLADVIIERDCLVTRMKTVERDLGTAGKAVGAPAKPLA